MPSARIVIRSLLLLTAALCLGLAGHTAQSWWAKRLAGKVCVTSRSRSYDALGRIVCIKDSILGVAGDKGRDAAPLLKSLVEDWRKTPWWGAYTSHHGWMPRRTYHEVLGRLTEKTLPSDPAAWEAWLAGQQGLVWDATLERVVPGTPLPTSPQPETGYGYSVGCGLTLSARGADVR